MTTNLLSDADLKAALAALPGERITDEYITSRIARTSFVLVDDITTVCIIVLDNGYRVFGHSTPASPENFREDIGRTYASKNAYAQLWPLFGFLLREKKFRTPEPKPDTPGLCSICGEPMPAGEEMFNYHGYSGPCPKRADEPKAVNPLGAG